MEDYVNIYICPHELMPEDTLTDGPDGAQFEITDNTLLIWVDFEPDSKFAHATAYILISAMSESQIRVEDGEWWPVLNGKQILYGSRNKLAVISPFELIKLHEEEKTEEDYINIYICPHELTPEDTLTDGPDGAQFGIGDNALLIWVDLEPEYRFEHPTIYILIYARFRPHVQVEDGGWWPVLNGKQILYDSRNKLAVISPFELTG